MSEARSTVAMNPVATPTGGILQRRCACGGPAGLQGECEDCQRKKALGVQARLIVGPSDDPFEREADRAAAQVLAMPAAPAPRLGRSAVPQLSRRAPAPSGGGQAAPVSVQRTLQSGGEPLSAPLRSFFEPRFDQDFSQVRIHRDSAAAASARDVAAHAYTVGQHVVFGSGQYGPDTSSGRNLIAHELAHVVQQRGVLQRHSVSAPPSGGPVGEEAEEEETLPTAQASPREEEGAGGISGLLQRQSFGEFEDDPWPEKTEASRVRAEAAAQRECLAAVPPDPAECDPARALTWGDFTASVPRGSSFGAMTFSGLRERSINTGLLRCMPDSPAAAGAPSRAVQAFMDPGQSWVKPEFASPGNSALNGCSTVIGQCQADFAGGGVGSWALRTTPSRTCPASAVPRGDSATSSAECTTVVGRDCADRAAAESARLLRHEQGHFNLSCAMARKANGMLATTPDFTALLGAARSTLRTQQSLYDTQSGHGCNASSQASWETAIAAGLPAVTITIPPAGGGRRGRGRGRR